MKIGTKHDHTRWQSAFRRRQDAGQPSGQSRSREAGRSPTKSAFQPVGVESEAKDIASDLDGAIEKNYKAALTAKGLDKEHIRFDAKNGVLTLKGKVKTRTEKAQAGELAQATPNVRQVLNPIDVNR